LQAYLDNALVHQYGDPTILTALDGAVRGILTGRPTFPFTGAQLALIAGVAAVLVGAGIGIRKLARPRSR
jgi:hypothetical protein